MKLLITKLLALAALGFISCTVEKDFSMSFDIDYAVNNAPAAYSSQDTIDASKESSDYSKYKSDIKRIDIESVTYTISDFNGSPTQTLTTAKLEVADTHGSAFQELGTVTNVTLLAAEGVETDLPLSQSGKDYLKSLLSGEGIAVIRFNAAANEYPVTFSVKFKIKTKVTFEKTIP